MNAARRHAQRFAIGLLAVFALSSAQAEEAQEKVQKPARVITSVVKSGAIVEAVDKESRELKLIAADGRRFTVVAGPEIRNFDQIEARDRIVVEYTESIAIVVTPKGTEGVEGAVGMVDVAAEGDKPGIAGLETVAVTATVAALDRDSRRATLELPDGSTRSIRAAADARLDLVDVGDQVTAVITESRAVSVVEPPEER